MAPLCLTSELTSPRRMHFLFHSLAGIMVILAIIMDSVASPEMMTSRRCRLQDGPEGVKAFCSSLALTSIPRDLPQNTTILDASLNLITTLHNYSFVNISHLTTLNVAGNQISTLDVGTFLPLLNLEVLVMTGNMLTQLQDNIFDSNYLLSRLILTNNHFVSVPSGALAKLDRLQEVSLSGNCIEKADFSAFYHLQNVSDINMRNNIISNLQASDFEPFQKSSLYSLNLAENRLVSLPPGVFSFLYMVENLELQGNSFIKLQMSSFLGNMTITKMSVANCRISTIIPLNASGLSTMHYPAIDSIEMVYNRLSSIPPYAFTVFNQTRSLVLARNKIVHISNVSFCGLDSLISLNISYNQISFLPPGRFLCNPRLQFLNASHNLIQILNPTSFHGLIALRELDLSCNTISGTELHIDAYGYQGWNNPALQILDISHNLYTTIKRSLLNGDLSNLTILNLSYNKIKTYSSTTFDNVPSLRELYLESESFLFMNGVFSQMKNLIKLDLSKTIGIYVSNKSRQFSETSSLEELRMCGNKLSSAHLYDNATRSSLFAGLVSLRKLNLKENNLSGLEPGVFSPLTNLSVLDMSKANISVLKPGLFKGLSSLRSLCLEDNKIWNTATDLFTGLDSLGSLFFQNNRLLNLNRTLFVATPNLRNLYISNNRLTHVQKDTFPSNDALLIDISSNPLSCTCALSWFRTWLDGGKVQFIKPDKTICSRKSYKAVIGLPILKFNPADFCGINIEQITGLFLFASVAAYVCVIVYHQRSWIRHKVLLLRLAIAGSGKIVEDFKAGTYDFHLNLMFHDEDEDWVHEIMEPILETRFPHLQNIVFGDEDLRLEMFYINAIYDAIENSFKTVLLLSKRSVEDVWCLTKLRLAMEHINETGLEKVILIFVEDLEDDDLPYLVRLFLRMNKPHMWWSDDEDEQELFWAQFERCMKANRALTDVIPL